MGAGESGIHPHPRLVNGSDHVGPYVALSYCWGPERLLTFTASNEDQLRSGIPLSEFPPTLRDAVEVTRSLGYQFLWIDALCIQQDSKADWDNEAAKMRRVYRGAVVTLSAAAASKASDGMLYYRSMPLTICRLPWLSSVNSQQSVFLRPAIEVMDQELRVSVINTRGWTFQEALLAPRTLWFGREQLIYECSNGQVTETGHTIQSTEYYRSKDMMRQLTASRSRLYASQLLRWLGMPAVVKVPYYTLRRRASLSVRSILWHQPIFTQGSLTSQSGRTFSYYDHWCEIVGRYTERNLSYRLDTLPALSGLAEHFARATGDEYLAGMWKHDFIRCLNWRREPLLEHRQRAPSYKGCLGRPLDYVAPSWSWASVVGGSAELTTGLQGSRRIWEHARVLKVSVSLETEDPYGRVTGGRLVLCAPFLSISAPHLRPIETTRFPAFQDEIWMLLSSKDNDYHHTFYQHHALHADQEYGLVQTCTTKDTNIDSPAESLHMIIVETAGQTCRYRRVGHYQLPLSGVSQKFWVDLGNNKAIREELLGAKWTRRTIEII